MWNKESEIGAQRERVSYLWVRKERKAEREEEEEKELECPQYFPFALCGPSISQAAGQTCAYRALLADSYHQTPVEVMTRWRNEERLKLPLEWQLTFKSDGRSTPNLKFQMEGKRNSNLEQKVNV